MTKDSISQIQKPVPVEMPKDSVSAEIVNSDTLLFINSASNTYTLASDSITTIADSSETTVSTILVRKEGNLRELASHGEWIWGVIIAALVLFASTRLIFNKYLISVFSSLFNYTASSHLYRERGYSLVHGAFRLDLLFLLTFTTFLYQLLSFYEEQIFGFEGYKLFLVLLVFIISFSIIKFFTNSLISYIADERSVLAEIIFTKHLFYKALGAILLPSVIVNELDSPYLEKFFIISSVIIITFYIISLSRSLFTGLKKGISISYLILYLCTLEILPLLIILKLFIQQE